MVQQGVLAGAAVVAAGPRFGGELLDGFTFAVEEVSRYVHRRVLWHKPVVRAAFADGLPWQLDGPLSTERWGTFRLAYTAEFALRLLDTTGRQIGQGLGTFPFGFRSGQLGARFLLLRAFARLCRSRRPAGVHGPPAAAEPEAAGGNSSPGGSVSPGEGTRPCGTARLAWPGRPWRR